MKGILRKAKLWELRETTLCNQPATAQAPDFAALEAEIFRSAHNQLYACRHYLLTHGGPGDVHNIRPMRPNETHARDQNRLCALTRKRF